jgi:hypothetical protein
MRAHHLTMILTAATGALAAQPPMFARDANGAPAIVERTWTVSADDGNILGVLGTLVRCGDMAFITDVRAQRILRLNLRTGVQEPGWSVDVPPFAIGADCGRDRLFVAGGGSRAMAAFEIDARTGTKGRQYRLPATLFPQGGLSVVDAGGAHVIVGGVALRDGQDTAERLGNMTIDRFYSDKTIAARVALDSGAVTPAFQPFHPGCSGGAGTCMRATFTPNRAAGAGWIVTQPTSASVGLYDDGRALVRTLDVRSPLFRRTGPAIPTSSAAEPEVRWAAENSLVHRAYSFPDGSIAVVHSLMELPKGWSFGLPIQFQAWMNVYDAGGRGIVSDVRLPELPIGQDDTHIYVADYGPDRRTGAYEQVRILQVAVPRR